MECSETNICPGSRSNWRQESEEEVVKGQGYVCNLIKLHSSIARYCLVLYAFTLNVISSHLRRVSDSTCCADFRRAVKDKANHAVVLDKTTADKLQKDVQSYRLITVAVLVDRLKINGSLARAALKDLEEKGQIKKVVSHSKMLVYSE